MVKFLAQTLVTVAASIGAAMFLGFQTYLIIAALLAVVSAGLLVNSSEAQQEGALLGGLPVTLITSTLFGMFWPVLPLAFAWGRTSHRISGDDVVPVEDDTDEAP